MFSVVIPLYNKKDHIFETLSSVLSQSEQPNEIIIIDDGSRDGSLEIVKSIADDRIKIMATPSTRSGPSVARNIGVTGAKMDWIAFLDADDHWEEDYLKSVKSALEGSPDNTVCAFSAYWIRNASGKLLASRFGKQFKTVFTVNFEKFVELWVSERWCPMWTSAVVVARRPFLNSGGFPPQYRRGEDKVAWLRIMRQGNAIYLPKRMATYNLNVGGQETSVPSNERHPACIEIANLIEDSSGSTRQNLKKLYNLQIIRYSRDVAGKEKLSHDLVFGFYIMQNPIWYLIISIMRFVHPSIVRSLLSFFAAFKIKSLVRKLV